MRWGHEWEKDSCRRYISLYVNPVPRLLNRRMLQIAKQAEATVQRRLRRPSVRLINLRFEYDDENMLSSCLVGMNLLVS